VRRLFVLMARQIVILPIRHSTGRSTRPRAFAAFEYCEMTPTEVGSFFTGDQMQAGRL
jgi:hypothetical protein